MVVVLKKFLNLISDKEMKVNFKFPLTNNEVLSVTVESLKTLIETSSCFGDNDCAVPMRITIQEAYTHEEIRNMFEKDLKKYEELIAEERKYGGIINKKFELTAQNHYKRINYFFNHLEEIDNILVQVPYHYWYENLTNKISALGVESKFFVDNTKHMNLALLYMKFYADKYSEFKHTNPNFNRNINIKLTDDSPIFEDMYNYLTNAEEGAFDFKPMNADLDPSRRRENFM